MTQLNGNDGLKNWITMFCDQFFDEIPKETQRQIITKVVNNLEEDLFINNRWFADYKRIRVIGIKE